LESTKASLRQHYLEQVMRVGADGAPSQPMSAPRVFFSLPLMGR
jgi:hypothetical protein